MIKTTTTLILAVSATFAMAQEDAWKEMQKVADNIQAPKIFPKEYKIENYGASVDSSAEHNTIAINEAICAANSNGGGTVVVGAGTWNTGPITLLSNVCLKVEKDGELLFSTRHEMYLPVVRTRWEGIDCYNLHPLIYANGQHDIAITGEGTINGHASNKDWWYMCGAKRFGYVEGMLTQKRPGLGRQKLSQMEQNKVNVEERKMSDADGLRPQLINFYECERILIENVTLRNSPFWVIHPTFVDNMIVRNVKIYSHGPNSDGCDPESSTNILIENCIFDTGDDCIAIKSGRNNDGRLINKASENIIVRNCQMKDGHGGVVIGSEIASGYRNLWVENCKMDSPELERVIRIKTNNCRGGIIENVYVRNIEVGQCKEAVLKINLDYDSRENCQRDFPPIVRNVSLENVTSQKSKYGVRIIGYEESTNIENIKITNCSFNGVAEGNKIDGLTNNIVYKNYKQNGEKQKSPKAAK